MSCSLLRIWGVPWLTTSGVHGSLIFILLSSLFLSTKRTRRYPTAISGEHRNKGTLTQSEQKFLCSELAVAEESTIAICIWPRLKDRKKVGKRNGRKKIIVQVCLIGARYLESSRWIVGILCNRLGMHIWLSLISPKEEEVGTKITEASSD